jgi:penicillin-binding protein 1A
VVLAQMAKGNIITEKEKKRDSVYQLLLILNWKAIEDQRLISESTCDYMKKWVDENKKPDGSDYDIYGLKIYTTIDSRMQLHAEEAVSAHMANLQEFFIQAKK